MRIVIKKDNQTLLHAIFILWIISEMMFQNTLFSRAALILFVGASVILTHRISWTSQMTGYAAFILWSLLNIVTGHAVSRTTAMGMIKTLLLNLLFLYAFVCYCRYIADVSQILRVIRGVSVLLCIPLLIGGLGNVLSGMRLTILGINSNRIAKLLAYAVIIAVYEQLNREKRQLKDWVSVLVLLLTVLLTGSRKGLLIPIIGVYTLVCVRKPKKFIQFSIAGGALAIVLLFLLLNVDVLYDLVGYRVKPVLQLLQGEEFAEASLDSRVDSIALAWNASQDSLFWGHGLDCFRLLAKSYGGYTHCNYVEILYSLGWVGVIIYYLPFAYGFFNMYKYRNASREAVGVMAAMLVPFTVCDYMNVTYFDRISLLIPAIALATVSKRGMIYEYKKIA